MEEQSIFIIQQLQHPEEVNHVNNIGETALHVATARAKVSAMASLLRPNLNCDPNIRTTAPSSRITWSADTTRVTYMGYEYCNSGVLSALKTKI